MATTKQIDELNRAAALNNGDILAVAQADKDEAQGVPVSMLAQKVADLNTQGALTELALATSIGKNLLAQRLNEKGVECAPTDTLVSMADKVNNLIIDGQSTNVITPVIVSTTTAGVTTNACMQYVGAKPSELGSLVVLDQSTNTIRLVPNGAYSSISDALLNAVASLDVPPNTNRLRALGISQNEKYVITDIDTNKINIYEVNAAAGTLTLKHEITTKNDVFASTRADYDYYLQYLTVSNDGDRYAFWTPSHEVVIGSVSKDKELKTTSVNNYGQEQIFFLEGTKYVGILFRRHYDYGPSGYVKIEYDFDKETIHLFQVNGATNELAYFEPRTQKIIVEEIIANTNLPYRNAADYRITIRSSDDYSVLFDEKVQIVVPLYAISSYYSKNYKAEGTYYQVAFNEAEDTFSFISPVYGPLLDYNRKNNTFVVHKKIVLMDPHSEAGAVIFYKNGTALKIKKNISGLNTIYPYGIQLGSTSSTVYEWTNKEYYIGSIRINANNGNMGIFTMLVADPASTKALVETGVLDVNTPKMEIK